MSSTSPLPPGQKAHHEFPRFGLTRFASRFPRNLERIAIHIEGDVDHPFMLSTQWLALPRVTLIADFHCVTTWSYRAIAWGGVRFREVYERTMLPGIRPGTQISWVVFKCQDGYRTILPLADALADEVLLADTMNGAPLSLEHGAPVRVVAPAHYGYKNAKHIDRIELLVADARYTPQGPKFIEHPRARVAYEERARYLPGWVCRYLYRPLIAPTSATFRKALNARAVQRQADCSGSDDTAAQERARPGTTTP